MTHIIWPIWYEWVISIPIGIAVRQSINSHCDILIRLKFRWWNEMISCEIFSFWTIRKKQLDIIADNRIWCKENGCPFESKSIRSGTGSLDGPNIGWMQLIIWRIRREVPAFTLIWSLNIFLSGFQYNLVLG